MDFFQIIFKPSAEHELRQLPPKLIVKASRMIEELASNPYPQSAAKLIGENALELGLVIIEQYIPSTRQRRLCTSRESDTVRMCIENFNKLYYD